jgi:hypothetical protein
MTFAISAPMFCIWRDSSMTAHVDSNATLRSIVPSMRRP